MKQDTLAQSLEGMTVDGGWKVIKKVDQNIANTGGLTSIGYIVESKNGDKAFLKALDFAAAFKQIGRASEALESMTAAYNHECAIVELCKLHKMDRIVLAITKGEIPTTNESLTPVPYLIFECADCDVRKFIDTNSRFNDAWILRLLHQVTTGLMQLHSQEIAHQDLKPANILVFDERNSKIGDLGSASTKSRAIFYDKYNIAGDTDNAPPELVYHHCDPDWNTRRKGCDLYLLGSMCVYLFSRANLTDLIISELDGDHHPVGWGGTYSEVLPYVREAFGRAVNLFLQDVPSQWKKDIGEIVRQLCDPDPSLRGHPLNRRGHSNRFSLERFVSKFNLLAVRAEIELRSER